MHFVTNIAVSIIVAMFLVLIFYNIFVEFLGPQLNDNYAKEQLELLELTPLPTGIRVVDSSKYVGHLRDEGAFIVWVGLAVETELTIYELNKQIHSLSEFENAVIDSYSLEQANQWNFTGVQKEVDGKATNNYYIIGKTMKPQTSLDKRNR